MSLLANAEDVKREMGARFLGLGRSAGGGHGSPLQCSCLENPMDRGAWRPTVHGVEKSRTQLSDFTYTFTLDILKVCYVFYIFSKTVSPKYHPYCTT